MRSTLAVLVVAVVLGAACNDDPERSAPARAPLTSAVATTTTSPPASDDERVARDLVVRHTDFPPGWNHSQPADQVEDPADRCLKTGPLASAKARAESDEFAKTDLATASSVALVFADTASADAAFAHASGAEMRTCFDQALKAEVAGEGVGEGEEGVELADASFRATAAYPPVPEKVTAYEFTAQTAGTDQAYRYSAHLVVVKAGRALLAFAFGNLGDAIPLDEQQTVAGRVAARALQ